MKKIRWWLSPQLGGEMFEGEFFIEAHGVERDEKRINLIANEAVKILKDYPHLKYYEAINKAKEVLKDDRDKVEKLC